MEEAPKCNVKCCRAVNADSTQYSQAAPIQVLSPKRKQTIMLKKKVTEKYIQCDSTYIKSKHYTMYYLRIHVIYF